MGRDTFQILTVIALGAPKEVAQASASSGGRSLRFLALVAWMNNATDGPVPRIRF